MVYVICIYVHIKQCCTVPAEDRGGAEVWGSKLGYTHVVHVCKKIHQTNSQVMRTRSKVIKSHLPFSVQVTSQHGCAKVTGLWCDGLVHDLESYLLLVKNLHNSMVVNSMHVYCCHVGKKHCDVQLEIVCEGCVKEFFEE